MRRRDTLHLTTDKWTKYMAGHRFISLKFSAIFLVMVPLAKLTPKALGERKKSVLHPHQQKSAKRNSRGICRQELCGLGECAGAQIYVGSSVSNPMKTLYPSKKISVVLWTPNFGFVSLLKEGMRSIFFICRLGNFFFPFFGAMGHFFQVGETCFDLPSLKLT